MTTTADLSALLAQWRAGAKNGASMTDQLQLALLGAVEALRKLRAEVTGMIGLAEPELRSAIGNTNVNVLLHWRDNADAALARLRALGEERSDG